MSLFFRNDDFSQTLAGLETAPGKTPNPVVFLIDPDQDDVRAGDYVQLSDLQHLENQEDQTAAKAFQMSRGLPIFSELAQEHKTVKTLQLIQNIGLQSSLLSANSHPQTLKFDLAHSFRFTERLALAMGHACYNDNLLSAGDRPELKNFSKFPRCSMAAPIAFHECSTMESRVQKSFTNHGQVHQAVELLEQLAALRPEVESGEASVVVLSPYAAAVTEKFPAMRVRAATVDQYQGQEAEVAFFITTRTATQNHRKTPSSVHHSIPALVLK
ncbi:unnamed protein product [Bursaphelenchus xylophilus]|uniref:(pine wood nematode) hypothetical protein n=1 Tax=Bursaphelenchus xylophilus TaxID=6326 RepID=A0A7I8WZK0_BURXY|nr:unnamed protein product [Bursaphelenchus xylophilus]CAG9129349.1 unnamed protein product [Bursaphelenchus xylophilus]